MKLKELSEDFKCLYLKGSDSRMWEKLFGEKSNQLKQTKFCFTKEGQSPGFKSKAKQNRKTEVLIKHAVLNSHARVLSPKFKYRNSLFRNKICLKS